MDYICGQYLTLDGWVQLPNFNVGSTTPGPKEKNRAPTLKFGGAGGARVAERPPGKWEVKYITWLPAIIWQIWFMYVFQNFQEGFDASSILYHRLPGR